MQVCGSDSSTWSSGCCSGKSNFSPLSSKNLIQRICQWWDKDSGSGNEDLHKQLEGNKFLLWMSTGFEAPQPILEISDELSFLKDHYDFFSLPLLYLQGHVGANNIFPPRIPSISYREVGLRKEALSLLCFSGPSELLVVLCPAAAARWCWSSSRGCCWGATAWSHCAFCFTSLIFCHCPCLRGWF